MAAFSDYAENKLTDLLFRGQAFTAPATIYVSLHTGATTDAGGGTEVSGGSYARVAITANLTNWSGTQAAASTVASSGTGGASSNNGTVTFPTATANWGTVTHFGIWDAATTGNMLIHGALTASQVINDGGTASFAAAALVVTLA